MTTAPITLVCKVADLMGLTPVEAVALPHVITTCSRMAAMSEWALAERLLENVKLRDYLAGVCRKVMANSPDFAEDFVRSI